MKKLFGVLLISSAVLGLSSCYQNPDYGVGIIVVKDANQFRVPAAEITLSQPGQTGAGIPFQVGYTDQNGEYSYKHIDPNTDLAVEVILNIAAKKGNKIGQGVIRIKPGEVETEDVIIY